MGSGWGAMTLVEGCFQLSLLFPSFSLLLPQKWVVVVFCHLWGKNANAIDMTSCFAYRAKDGLRGSKMHRKIGAKVRGENPSTSSSRSQSRSLPPPLAVYILLKPWEILIVDILGHNSFDLGLLCFDLLVIFVISVISNIEQFNYL